MVTNTSDSQSVKTTETAFAIIDALEKRNGARVSEVAGDLDLAKSTVYRHLTTLVEQEWAAKEGDIYHVGLRFVEIGEHARTRKKGYQMAGKKVEELAAETDERAQFIVEEHGEGVYIYRGIGSHAVRTDSGIGKRVPLHAISAGKAILARMSEEKVDQILDRQGLPSLTPNTITTREKLFDEFESIRKQGYSVNNEENIEGLCAVGVPIKNKDGSALGALSVSGPTRRMKGPWFEQDLPDLLLGTANELELNIMYA